MQITFNTAEIKPKEAAGLAALLVTLHGDAVLAALEDVDRPAPTGAPISYADLKAREYLDQPDPRAADGHPMPPETNAAEAFGAAPAPAGDLDSAGTPWDERIHSGSRGTNKDGTWTRRRNTPDETFDTVMAELKGKPRDAQPIDPHEDAVGADPEPEAAPAAPPPPPPAPPASAAPITFPTLMVKITKAQGAGQITKATVDGFIKELGATSMAQLASQPDKLAELNALVDATLGG